MFELTLALLQVLGVFLAGLFGLLGLLTKYRDDKGKITKWGHVALVGIIVSTLMAVSAQVLEAVRKARESQAAAQRTERVVAEIARAIHPLSDIEVTAWAVMPLDHAQLAAYRSRVVPEIRRIHAEWSGNVFEQPAGCRRLLCLVGNRPSHTGTPKTPAELVTGTVSFRSKSALFPKGTAESPARHLTATRIHISVYKNHIDPKSFTAMWSSSSNPADLSFSIDPRDPELTYELAHQKLVVYLSGKAEPRFWDSRGTVVAVPDLLNAQMLISLVPGSLSPEEVTGMLKPSKGGGLPRVSDSRYALKLESVLMRLGGRHMVLQPGDRVESHTSADGFTVWSYVFPATLEELAAPQAAKGVGKHAD